LNQAQIVGFYDPCLGESKKLRITYKFQGKLHQIEVDDRGAVAAPLRGLYHLSFVGMCLDTY
jgi:DnaJ family protein C protein 11